jgi:hypothetical protein
MSMLHILDECPCSMSKSREITPLSLVQIRRNFGKMKPWIHFVSAKFRQDFGETTISFRRNKPLFRHFVSEKCFVSGGSLAASSSDLSMF